MGVYECYAAGAHGKGDVVTWHRLTAWAALPRFRPMSATGIEQQAESHAGHIWTRCAGWGARRQDANLSAADFRYWLR